MPSHRVDLDQLDTAELLRRGIGAARAGDADIARKFLEEVVEREPEEADGWLWLASVDMDPQAKRGHFQRVLALRPGDPEAEAGLEGLAEKYGRGILTEDASDGPVPQPCTWHPDRETLLRCARCDKPMCTACARQHPVGLRCKECAKELRSPLYKVAPAQFLGALAVAAAAGLAAAVVMGAVAGAFCWLAIFLAYAAGLMIGDAASWGAARKRGRPVQAAAVAGIIIGVGIFELLFRRVGLASLGRGGLPFNDIGPLLVLFISSAAAIQRLR